MMEGPSILNVLQTLVVLLAVIALANVTLKYLGKKISTGHQTIEILEKCPTSGNSSVAVVRIANGYYLMSLSDHGHSILKELEPGEVKSIQEPALKGEPIPVLGEWIKIMKKKGKTL